MVRVASVVIGCLASAEAFTIVPHAAPRAQMARCAEPQANLVLGTAVTGVVAGTGFLAKKWIDNRPESKEVTDFRGSLAGMESLAGLSDLKLEREEKEGRRAGVWKEYIKNDGKKWYYNTETKIQQWIVPDEFKKLDEIAAAAAAKNEARGTVS